MLCFLYFIYLMPTLTNSFLSIDEVYIFRVNCFDRVVVNHIVKDFVNGVKKFDKSEVTKKHHIFTPISNTFLPTELTKTYFHVSLL